MQKEPAWINNKYISEKITLNVEVALAYRIKRHRTELIRDLKKQIKDLNEYNTNVKIIKKVSENK